MLEQPALCFGEVYRCPVHSHLVTLRIDLDGATLQQLPRREQALVNAHQAQLKLEGTDGLIPAILRAGIQEDRSGPGVVRGGQPDELGALGLEEFPEGLTEQGMGESELPRVKKDNGRKALDRG